MIFELKILSMSVPGRSSGQDGKQQRMAGTVTQGSVGVVSVQHEDKKQIFERESPVAW